MTKSRFTHAQLVELITEMLSTKKSETATEEIRKKHDELGISALFEEAYDQWRAFYEGYQLIQMVEMHMMYDSMSEEFSDEFSAKQKKSLGTKILDGWIDETKALAAMHTAHLQVGAIEPLFDGDKLHIFMHRSMLRISRMQGDLGFGDEKDSGRN